MVQRPANPIATEVARNDLAVGMGYWTHSRNRPPEATSTSGAGAWDLVQWAIGSRTGRTKAAGGRKVCWDVLTTIVEWSLPNTSWHGVMWNVGADAKGVREVAAGCGGSIIIVLGDHVGPGLGGENTTTLEVSRKLTLGGEGARR
jgi:hypothetical protein